MRSTSTVYLIGNLFEDQCWPSGVAYAQTIFYTSQNSGLVLAVVITSLVRKFQTALVSRCVNEYGGNRWPIVALVLQFAQLILQSTPRDKWSGPHSILLCTGSAYLQWQIGGSGYESVSAMTTSPKSQEPAPAVLENPRLTLLQRLPSLHNLGGVDISTQHHHFMPWDQLLIKMQAKTVLQRMCACNTVDVICAI